MSPDKQLRRLAAILKSSHSEPSKAWKAIRESGLIGGDGTLVSICNDRTADTQARNDSRQIIASLMRVRDGRCSPLDAAEVIRAVLDCNGLKGASGDYPMSETYADDKWLFETIPTGKFERVKTLAEKRNKNRPPEMKLVPLSRPQMKHWASRFAEYHGFDCPEFNENAKQG